MPADRVAPWLAPPSSAAVAGALSCVAPDLAGLPVRPRGGFVSADPLYWSSSAAVGDQFVVKYAWSRAAAARLRHEITVLPALLGRACPTSRRSSRPSRTRRC